MRQGGNRQTENGAVSRRTVVLLLTVGTPLRVFSPSSSSFFLSAVYFPLILRVGEGVKAV